MAAWSSAAWKESDKRRARSSIKKSGKDGMAAVVLVATVEKEETTPFFRHRSDRIMVWGVGFTGAASSVLGALSGGFVEMWNRRQDEQVNR